MKCHSECTPNHQHSNNALQDPSKRYVTALLVTVCTARPAATIRRRCQSCDSSPPKSLWNLHFRHPTTLPSTRTTHANRTKPTRSNEVNGNPPIFIRPHSHETDYALRESPSNDSRKCRITNVLPMLSAPAHASKQERPRPRIFHTPHTHTWTNDPRQRKA